MPSELNMHSQHCVDLLLNGLKVTEGIPSPYRKILHNISIHDECIVINITKVLNGDLPLPYALVGADTLSEAVGGFIQWHTSQIVNHIRPSLQNNEMTRSQDHVIMSDNRSSFILRKVKLLHKCSECKDCIAIALVTNVNEKDFIGGMLLGAFSFGVLVEEVLCCCMAYSQGLSSESLVSWPIKKIEDFNTGSVLFVENNNQFEAAEDFRDSSENHNIKFLGEMVNLIHKCSLKTNYIAWGIMTSVIEGDIVQFKPLDCSEFGILIQKVFRYCEECGLSKGCLIRWPAYHLLDLNDIPLDVRLKMNTEEDMVNFWNIFEEFPLQIVLPGDSISDDVKINTTRRYNSVKRKVRTIISKIKSSSTYKVGIDEAASFAKLSKEKCCLGLCISKITTRLISECLHKFHCMNENSRREYALNALAANVPIAREGYEIGSLRGKLFTMKLDTIDFYQNAWYKCHGIKRSTFYNYKKLLLNGDVRDVHGNSGSKKARSNTVAMVASIKNIVEENSHKSPHLTRICEDGIRTFMKLLPADMSHGLLQKMANEEIEQIGLQPVSQSSFSKVMREQFPDVAIAKNNFFAKCNECISIQNKLKGTTDLDEEKEL